MGKGLPKKYAKMGFKKGWKEYKAQQRKTAAKRKNPPKPKSKSSSKPSTTFSNPGGGARTDKLGAIFKKIKAAFNLTAAAQGSATYPSGTWNLEDKLENAIARHTGYLSGTDEINIDYALETYKGIATEIGVQYFDSKTRHFGNISKGKLLDVAEELIPIVMAHEDAKQTGKYMTNFARSYHKLTQGYDMHGGLWGDWDLDRAKGYLTVKIVRAIGNKTGAVSFINKHLPKGLNL